MNQNDTPKLKIRLLEIRSHIHATEDPSKVKSAIINTLGIESENLSEKELVIDTLKGTFSNPIKSLLLKFTNKGKINKIMSQLSQKLSTADRKRLNSQLENRLTDKFKLFFRIEKQDLLDQRIVLAKTKDVVQIIIAIQNKSPYIPVDLNNIRNFLQSFGLIEMA